LELVPITFQKQKGFTKDHVPLLPSRLLKSLKSYFLSHLSSSSRNVPKTTPVRAPWYWFQSCVGADPNRNFDLEFGKASTSANPCSNIFAGDHAFR
jgi:hypothetical protein